jgi:hypothetical protein
LRFPLEQHQPGRPAMLSDETKQWIPDHVRHRFGKRCPPRFAELEQELADRFALYIKPDTFGILYIVKSPS